MKQVSAEKLMLQLGFTDKEIQAAQKLAAEKEFTMLQVLRQSLRIYQIYSHGHFQITTAPEPVGCPDLND